MRMDHCNTVWLRMLELSTDYSHSHHSTQLSSLALHIPTNMASIRSEVLLWPVCSQFAAPWSSVPAAASTAFTQVQRLQIRGVMTVHWLMVNSSGRVYTSAMLSSLEVLSICNISAEDRCKCWLDNIYMETDMFHGCSENGSSVCGTKVCLYMAKLHDFVWAKSD